MQRQRIVHQTKSARARRDKLMRAGVWVFILMFAFSVVGGLIVIGQQLASH
jgi:Na+/proline symporter